MEIVSSSEASKDSIVLLDPEAQNILSTATKSIPADIWQAIALAEQSDPPVAAPAMYYSTLGTTGAIHAVTDRNR